ncbi:metallophosphoesterase [Flagellimonas sp. HMM57]|uniref:metallophosphoesterase n=1 Tax=unclassified Flagellimonas TaxID=2644544 RepID=UPI0013CFB924|nr:MULTISPECIES: metallophosphoesterase [unclassified Flagellimonas]UII74888.1 metallophosphoesterase [Flagellimonas sp. HMM57]
MKPYFLVPVLLLYFSISYAQDKPTIYIDIPTEQKPWNHIDWNASPEQFQFAIVTDRTGGRRPGVFAKGVEKLNLLQPEFVMSVGDLIDGYTRDTVRLNAEWNEFQGFIKNLKSPFFYVPGNHDITNEVMEEKWNELFGVSYYHFVYKDVLFLCLNSEDNLRGAGRGTIDDKQYDYIKKTLEDNADVKWTLVFLHQPLWVQEDTKRWKDVEALLQKRNHNVFAGHYHRYWKSQRNNGKYIALATTGGGSRLRGKAYGEFDHVVWATMTDDGPILANLFLDGIWDEDITTEEMVKLVRDRPFPVRIEPVYLEEKQPETIMATVKATNSTDTRMHVKLTGHANNDLFYELEEDLFVVEPNDVTTFNLNIRNINSKMLDAFSKLDIEAEITYEFKDKPNVAFTSNLKFMPFYKNKVTAVSKIRLDGNLKEWDTDWISADNMDGSPFDYDGNDDCSLKFATAFDDKNFYVAVDLTDDEFLVNDEGSYWKQDGLILAFDARPIHLSAFNEGQGRGSEWISYLRTFRSEKTVYREERLPVKILAAQKKTDKGMHMEFSIPVSYLNGKYGDDWSSLRFGIGYSDYDTEDENPTYHFWFPAWNDEEDIPGSGMLFKE